jgi:hypothetical protein
VKLGASARLQGVWLRRQTRGYTRFTATVCCFAIRETVPLGENEEARSAVDREDLDSLSFRAPTRQALPRGRKTRWNLDSSTPTGASLGSVPAKLTT